MTDRDGSGDTAGIDELIELATEQGEPEEPRRLADKDNATAAEQLAELTAESGLRATHRWRPSSG